MFWMELAFRDYVSTKLKKTTENNSISDKMITCLVTYATQRKSYFRKMTAHFGKRQFFKFSKQQILIRINVTLIFCETAALCGKIADNDMPTFTKMYFLVFLA